MCGGGTSWVESESKCAPQSSVCGRGTSWVESERKCATQSSVCGRGTVLVDGKCACSASESLDDASIAARATSGYDLATDHCDLGSLDANTAGVKVSDCYATCASNADCAAFVFQNANPGNTTCWLKTTSATAAADTDTCAASSGLSADKKLVPTANSVLSFYEVKPNSIAFESS